MTELYRGNQQEEYKKQEKENPHTSFKFTDNGLFLTIRHRLSWSIPKSFTGNPEESANITFLVNLKEPIHTLSDGLWFIHQHDSRVLPELTEHIHKLRKEPLVDAQQAFLLFRVLHITKSIVESCTKP